MKTTDPWFFSRGVALMAGVAMLGWSTGCGNIFAPKHKVTVDAICAAGVAKPAGQSFRLVGKKSVLSLGQVNIGVVSACVGAALAHAGMYEAPEKTPADILIEVSCGQDNAPRTDPGSRETYLELSARTNAGRAMEHSREPEIWNVRVSIQGLVGRVESAMPLLAAVASSYSATDTKIQTLIEVPQSNASIAAVREAAMKTLDAKASSTAATTAVAIPTLSGAETK